jgi:hypothetical protein
MDSKPSPAIKPNMNWKAYPKKISKITPLTIDSDLENTRWIPHKIRRKNGKAYRFSRENG